MTGIGHGEPALVAATGAPGRQPDKLFWPLAGLLAALLPSLWMWGFCVDDAWISVRYARNLAEGAGYRFHPLGPSTDGVTPLPWPFVLAPLARADPVDALLRAKALGLLCWAAAGARLGAALGEQGDARPLARGLALVVVGLSVPLAAHAVSGMETALATALCTFAAASPRPWLRAVLAGLASAFRPELLPWSLCLAAVPELGRETERMARASALALLASIPFGLCVLVRLLAWGHVAPLSVQAKPSDLSHGLAYAGAAFLACLTPLLALSPLATLRSGKLARGLAVAAVAHAASVVFVGGDWMPYARLVAPIAPGLALLTAISSARSSRGSLALRGLLALSLGAYLAGKAAPQGRGVLEDRLALVREARPVLAGARRIAALDVGWVSASSGAPLVDLAGLTDPDIAALGGGHTSKRVPPSLLLTRDVDLLLVYVSSGVTGERPGDLSRATGMRAVEARLLGSTLAAERFAPKAFLRLGSKGAGYIVLRRIDAPP